MRAQAAAGPAIQRLIQAQRFFVMVLERGQAPIAHYQRELAREFATMKSALLSGLAAIPEMIEVVMERQLRSAGSK